MKHTFTSRFAALLLAVCMLISFIPSGIAAYTGEGASYYYNMGRLQYGQWSDNGVSPEALTSWEALDELENFHERTSDPFMFYKKSGSEQGKLSLMWNSSSAGGTTGYGPRGTAIEGEEGTWYGLIIRVGEDGVYTPYARAADQKTATQLNYYLAPYGVADPMAEQYYLGTSVANSSDLYSLTSSYYENQYLPAGDYVVMIEVAKHNTSSNAYAYFAGFGLDRVADTADWELVLTGSAPTGYIDEEVEIDLSAAFYEEDIALADLDALSIAAIDPEVAEVRERDGKFYLFGMWEGETTLRVSAREQSKVTAIDIPVTVEMPEGYVRMELWPDEFPISFFAQEPTTVPVRYTINREDVVVPEEDVEIVLENPSIADVELDADGNLVITGRESGTTKGTFTANFLGETASFEFEITTSDVKFHYNYHRAFYGPWSTYAREITYFTDFGMEEKEFPPGTVDQPYWGDRESDPWKFGGKSTLFTAGVTSSFNTMGWYASGSPGDWANMIIRVPEAGTYKFVVQAGTIAAGGCFRIFVSPVGTPEENWRDEEYYIGDVECAGAGSASGVMRVCNNVTLDAADYNVVYQFKPGAIVGNGCFMSGIYLKQITEDQFTMFAYDPAPIMETADGEIELTARLNGAEIDFSEVTDMAVKSANSNIATAEVVHEGENAKIVVHGKTPGKTTLTVTAKRNGLDASYVFNIDIAEKKRIYSVELTADSYELTPGTTTPTTLTGVYYDGTPIDFSDLSVYYETKAGKTISVDKNGNLTAIEKGEAQINVWVKQVSGDVETVCMDGKLFAVGTYSEIGTIDIVMPEELKTSARTVLSTDITLKSGLKLDPSLYTVTYSIEAADPENCARLSKATLQGRSVGTATIKATVEFNGNTYEETETIAIVKTLSNESVILPDKIILEIAKDTLCLGEFTKVNRGVYYDDGVYYEFDDATMSFEYDEAVLSYEDGVFTAIGAGETDVTMTVGDVSETVKVTVLDETIGSASVKLDKVLYEGKTAKISVEAFSASGNPITYDCLDISYADAGDGIVSVDTKGNVTALAVGSTNVTVTVSLGSESAQAILPVEVLDNNVSDIQLTASSTVMKPDETTGVQLQVSVVSASGDITPADVENVSYESLNFDILDVDENGLVTPKGVNGKGVIRATFSLNGFEAEAEIEITVKSGKTESTYFTAERRQAIKDNVANYDWAKSTYDSIDAQGMNWAGREDYLLEFILTQEVPRGIWATYRYDPEYELCKYCGKNIVQITGNGYPWLFDNENYPFKIQCPECMRRFPTNDFKAFYDTGIDENGNWSYELAKQNGSHLLVNTQYPEMDEHIDKNGVLQNEGVHNWGVDDGYGYKTGRQFTTSYGVWDETYTWIAYWNHWGNYYSTGTTRLAINHSAWAYAYTGKKEYGRTAAILIDRIADVYPEMDTGTYEPYYFNNGWYGGRITGGIWETGVAGSLATEYDAVFDMYDDPYVVNYIQQRKEELGVKYDKSSPAAIRQHIEDHLLREILVGLEDRRIAGNEGMHQNCAVKTAVVLDTMPETKQWIDWATTGAAGVLNTMYTTVDREGQGDENSPQYNDLWIGQYSTLASYLGGYKNYQAANFFTNPKYVKMMKMNLPLVMTRNYTLQVGDAGGFATTTLSFTPSAMGEALVNGCDDPEIAQILYFLNGNSVSGPNGRGIMVDTKKLEDKIQSLIDEYGEYDFDKSTQMPAYGLGILRGGTYKVDDRTTHNTQRATTLWYGATTGHGGAETLTLTMAAYGLNVMPTLGYPSNTTGTGQTVNWERGTVSKNTVTVNAVRQKISDVRTVDRIGDPIHFDDSGKVQLVDGRNLWVYRDEGVEEYRRTAVTVEVDEGKGDAYTLDFFRIKGGHEHVYSFHGNSNEIYDYDKEALSPIRQTMGTYAGPDVPYGPGELLSGYDGFYDVDRTSYPKGKSFWVDFKINDFRDVLKGQKRDLHLRMTQVNDFELSDVSMASGRPPVPNNNPKEIKYVLAKREGENLDTLFTTVIEPYDKERFIEKIEPATIERTGGAGSDDQAKAVKVTLKNGRVDYIVYAANNKARYRVDDLFNFIGFVGVISYEDGEIVYRYMHDSTMLEGIYGDAQATGTVVDFTKELAFDNTITVKLDKNVDLNGLVGKSIFVKNGGGNHSGKRNGTFWIHGATQNADGTVDLDIGDITLINASTNGVFSHIIEEGQAFYIPLTTTDDASPIVEPIPDQVVSTGDTIEIPIIAESPIGKPLTYVITKDIIGASMKDNVFCFSPSGTQSTVAVTIDVTDGTHTTSIAFTVEVYGTNSAGGGGGGGGSDEPEEVTYSTLGGNVYVDSDGNVISAGPDKTPGTADDLSNVKKNDDGEYYYVLNDKVYTAGADGFLGTADDEASEDAVAPTEKFVDLGNHAWAKDAIYRLVDAGVIKGVAEDKFAPGAQITRADFAILLVRAWDLSADELGAFEDVAATDYFANEVGIASALGIVNGVGEGKFAPKNPITREQMMVMLARTLEAVKAEVKDVEDDVLADFSDADLISDYAVDAVKSMVGNGFIQGANGKINPQGNATRAEVAVLLDRILNK